MVDLAALCHGLGRSYRDAVTLAAGVKFRLLGPVCAWHGPAELDP
jgi:hypothetical protein